METSRLLFYFPVSGSPRTVNQSTALTLMQTLSEDWNEQETEYGKLFTEKKPCAVAVNEMGEAVEMPPKLLSGGAMKWNDAATAFFKQPIYGSCFLKSELEKMPSLVVRIFHMR